MPTLYRLEGGVLEDVLQPGLKLVVCGSAAGHRSAHLGQYYAGRGNKLWATLVTVGLTPRQLSPLEYRLLPSFGIGLTDLVKGQSGSDAKITFGSEGPEALRAKMLRYQPGVLCFNGKRAAVEYFRVRDVDFGLRSETIGVTKLFVAPSTSGAASGFWDELMWRKLADLVRVGVTV
jgi:TDG/mug DNA glycosylase family protein